MCVRERRAHKWSSGAVATIGGTRGLTGAAVLAGRAAIASGAGMSAILTTSGTAQTYETLAPDLVAIQASDSESWGDDPSQILPRLARFDTLIVGPGLSPTDAAFVPELARRFEGTLILDAGALDALDDVGELAKRAGGTVLTPHAGEFRRLTGSTPSPDAIRDLAERSGSVVVAKGSPTIVATGEQMVAVDSGGPELATIGTGDVLAGMIGAFTACGIPAHTAAASAAHIHGRAGRSLAERESVSAPALVGEVGVTLPRFTTRHCGSEGE